MADERYIINGFPRGYERRLAEKLSLAYPVDPSELRAAQLARFRGIAAYAARHSRFYRRLYAGYDLNDPFGLPLISGEDLRRDSAAMVCVSGSRVRRVVTMRTSGSTGEPKRLYFSEGDLELTVDFFASGMTYMTCPGDSALICFPDSRPDGLTDLLSRGLRRIDVAPTVCAQSDPALMAEAAERLRPQCVIGMPRQIAAMAELIPELAPKTVLLSGDDVTPELRLSLAERWGARVFSHWGMRETGLGGAVECPAHSGLHIRHDDLLIEIVDGDGKPLPPGEWGEIVITTLTREAMPLLRYRTGDISRLLPDACPCGSLLPRLDAVSGHKRRLLAAEAAASGANKQNEL